MTTAELGRTLISLASEMGEHLPHHEERSDRIGFDPVRRMGLALLAGDAQEMGAALRRLPGTGILRDSSAIMAHGPDGGVSGDAVLEMAFSAFRRGDLVPTDPIELSGGWRMDQTAGPDGEIGMTITRLADGHHADLFGDDLRSFVEAYADLLRMAKEPQWADASLDDLLGTICEPAVEAVPRNDHAASGDYAAFP